MFSVWLKLIGLDFEGVTVGFQAIECISFKQLLSSVGHQGH